MVPLPFLSITKIPSSFPIQLVLYLILSPSWLKYELESFLFMVEILESPFKSNTSGSYLSKRYLFIRSNHSHSVAPPQDIELLHLYPPVPESPVLPEPFSPVFPLLVFPLSPEPLSPEPPVSPPSPLPVSPPTPEPPVFPVLLLPPPVFPVLLSPPVPVLPVSLPALLSLFVPVLPTSSLLLSGLGLLTSALEPSKF